VRIVCATHRDLSADVRAQRFRADLYYRLNVFPIEVPPLRDRREDIPLLVDAFLRRTGERFGRSIERLEDDALQLFASYPWPGNVRELHNVLERAAILGRGPTLGLTDFSTLAESRGEGTPEESGSLRARVEAFEKALIAEVLRASNGNQSEAARRLQTTRQTLLYKIKAYGL
jgi:Nif-specific regulatory protein